MINKEQTDHEQILATIANLNAHTANLTLNSEKVYKELRWYQVTLIIAGTLAVVKLFL